MKKIVLTFGLISGLVISVLMDGSILISSKAGSSHSMALGYTIMVASFLLVYFGIRSYRDNLLHGQISFGRALACGLLITAITCACYVVTWEIVYFTFIPHFMDGYFASQVQQVQASTLDPATKAAKILAIRHSQQLYQNPLVNMAYTLIEPLPVGVVISLVSAALLRRKKTVALFSCGSNDCLRNPPETPMQASAESEPPRIEDTTSTTRAGRPPPSRRTQPPHSPAGTGIGCAASSRRTLHR